MDQMLDSIARKIKEFEVKRQNVAHGVRGISGFIKRVKDADLNCKILGVDGGFLRKEYHGANLILRRAVGACFSFDKNKLKEVSYYPSRKEVPEPLVVSSEMSDQDFNLICSFKRMEIEIKTALEALKTLKPDILVMDGSIVMHPSNQVERGNLLYDSYRGIIGLYKELFEYCSSKGIGLVGAVEDSKSKKVCGHLIDQLKNGGDILKNSTDTLFLYFVLNKGEYTRPMKCSGNFLREVGKFDIYSTYVKCADFDRPLRLEFLGDEKLVSTMFKISSQGKSYSYPSVLIEADARAKLKEYEIAILRDSIAEKLGRSPSLFELRREVRPWQ